MKEERRIAEKHRRRDVEEKLKLLEEKNDRIEKMKKEEAERIREEHRRKYEIAMENVKKKEFEKQLLWERNQMVLAEKYRKLKEMQIEKENSLRRKKEQRSWQPPSRPSHRPKVPCPRSVLLL